MTLFHVHLVEMGLLVGFSRRPGIMLARLELQCDASAIHLITASWSGSSNRTKNIPTSACGWAFLLPLFRRPPTTYNFFLSKGSSVVAQKHSDNWISCSYCCGTFSCISKNDPCQKCNVLEPKLSRPNAPLLILSRLIPHPCYLQPRSTQWRPGVYEARLGDLLITFSCTVPFSWCCLLCESRLV